MAIDTMTVSLLTSTLASPNVRGLFKAIANSRIAETADLKKDNPNADRELDALKQANLIDSGSSGEKYFVTAKGLKVARDLEQIPLG